MYERRPPVCTEPNDIEAFAMYEHARMLGGNAGSELEAAQLFRKCFKLSPTLARIYGMQWASAAGHCAAAAAGWRSVLLSSFVCAY
jgi:hypothetical protein